MSAVLAPEPAFCTRAEFARLQGFVKSYVTALDRAGRLVFNEDGLIDVAASRMRMATTNGAPERASLTTTDYRDARDRKEYYQAEAARLDFEERCGRLFDAPATLAAVTTAVVALRNGLEGLPEQMAPVLAPMTDEHNIRVMLADHIESLLSSLSAAMGVAAKQPRADVQKGA